MPFRQKMKRAIYRSGNDDTSLTLKQTNSSTKSAEASKPKEPPTSEPKPKYRGYVDPQHKAALDSFAFTSSDLRRKSKDSQYSPMGSRIPSRNNSVAYSHQIVGGPRGALHAFSPLHTTTDGSSSGSTNYSSRDSSESSPHSEADGSKTTEASNDENKEDYQALTDAEVNKTLAKLKNRLISKTF